MLDLAIVRHRLLFVSGLLLAVCILALAALGALLAVFLGLVCRCGARTYVLDLAIVRHRLLFDLWSLVGCLSCVLVFMDA